MKHLNRFNLKRINEDIENFINKEYIDNCFIEFADQGRYTSFSSSVNQFIIGIEIPKKYTDRFKENSITNTLNTLKWKINEYEEIENCLLKVKLKQPFLFYSISEEDHSNHEYDDDDDENSDFSRINLYLSKDKIWNWQQI